MDFDFELRIPAPRTKVFAFLGDPANRPRWQTSIQTIEIPPQGPLGVGTHWQETVRGAGTFAMEISAYEPHHLWAERIKARSFAGTVTMRFEDAGDDTRLRLEARITTRGLWRLVAPIGRLVLRREMRRDLGRVGALLA